jgi:hypothetical protein
MTQESPASLPAGWAMCWWEQRGHVANQQTKQAPQGRHSHWGQGRGRPAQQTGWCAGCSRSHSSARQREGHSTASGGLPNAPDIHDNNKAVRLGWWFPTHNALHCVPAWSTQYIRRFCKVKQYNNTPLSNFSFYLFWLAGVQLFSQGLKLLLFNECITLTRK